MSRQRGGVPLGVVIALFGAILVAAVVFVLFTEEGGAALTNNSVASAKGGDADAATNADGTTTAANADADRAETAADPEPPPPEPVADPNAIPADACGITGRIIGRDGKPLAGVELHVLRQVSLKETVKFGVAIDPKTSVGRFDRFALSDEAGRFTVIDLIPAQGYQLAAMTATGSIGQKWGVEALENLVFDVGDLGLRNGARVKGSVRTESGGAVPGAKVTVGWNWRSIDVISDAKGQFDAGVVYPGQQQILLDAPGYALKEGTQREFVEGDEIDDLELIVIPAAKISGRVYDETGRGIANANIWANKQQTDEEGWSGVWVGGQTTTDSNGLFEFASLGPGKYSINVQAPGFVYADETVEAGGPPLEFSMRRACTIEGLVVDAADGSPVKPDSIQLYWIPPWEKENANAELETYWGGDNNQVDIFDDGRFKYGLEQSGTFAVEASAKGYGSARSERFQLAERGSATGILIRLEKSQSLEVTVIDGATRSPIPGAIAEAWTLVREEGSDNTNQIRQLGYTAGRKDSVSRFGGQLGERKARVPTNLEGKAGMHSVQPGMHAVIARKNGYARGRVNDIEIVRGQPPAPVTVELTAGGSITGKITNEKGEPETTIKVLAYSVDNERGEALSLEGGVYSIEHLPPGRYKVEAQPEGGMYVNDRNSGRRREAGRELTMTERFPLLVEEGRAATQDLTVERIIPGSMKGMISINGRPAAGLNVSATWVDPNAKARRNYGWWGGNQVKTDAMGNFLFRRLRPGTYTVQVTQGWRRSYQVGEAMVHPEVESSVAFDIQLGGVYGRVLDPDGKPIPNVNLYAYRTQQDGSSSWSGDYSASTNENGEFTIEGMQAGSWNLNLNYRGYRQRIEQNIAITGYRNSGPYEIRLEKGGWMKIKLSGLARNGNDWPGLQVTIKNAQGQEVSEFWNNPEGDACELWVEYQGDAGATLTIKSGVYDNGPVFVGAANVPSTKDGVAELSVQMVPGV